MAVRKYKRDSLGRFAGGGSVARRGQVSSSKVAAKKPSGKAKGSKRKSGPKQPFNRNPGVAPPSAAEQAARTERLKKINAGSRAFRGNQSRRG